MASDKQRRKQAKKPKPTMPGKPFVHPDGDRRHRGGPDAKQAIRDKKTRATFTGGLKDEEE